MDIPKTAKKKIPARIFIRLIVNYILKALSIHFTFEIAGFNPRHGYRIVGSYRDWGITMDFDYLL